MFWGLNGPALGSRRVYAPCVNHLRHLRGSVGLWAAPSRTAAALRGGASPADAFPLLECTTEHGIRRKSIREVGQSLPSARGGRSRNGVTSAARLCGGAGRSSAVRGAGCFSEPRIPHESKRRDPVEVLRGQEGGEPCRRRGIARIRAHLRRRCRVEFGRVQRLGSGKVGLGGFQTPRWCSGVICDGCGALARRVHGGAETLHRR